MFFVVSSFSKQTWIIGNNRSNGNKSSNDNYVPAQWQEKFQWQQKFQWQLRSNGKKSSNSNKSSIVNKSSNGNKSPIAQNVILAVLASYDVIWACLEKKTTYINVNSSGQHYVQFLSHP